MTKSYGVLATCNVTPRKTDFIAPHPTFDGIDKQWLKFDELIKNILRFLRKIAPVSKLNICKIAHKLAAIWAQLLVGGHQRLKVLTARGDTEVKNPLSLFWWKNCGKLCPAGTPQAAAASLITICMDSSFNVVPG